MSKDLRDTVYMYRTLEPNPLFCRLHKSFGRFAAELWIHTLFERRLIITVPD